ncbi:hypothetical protein EVAR_40619_1 [Eumeta japonica]|uniref:Uncharacterized protein n=1 Tax=Eumeta variegata TaxID=151549 RepID=A0A4C1XFH4_EUMVA|nr:hypothetical protein EVAR_40619_1 [Eumeta japonica]
MNHTNFQKPTLNTLHLAKKTENGRQTEETCPFPLYLLTLLPILNPVSGYRLHEYRLALHSPLLRWEVCKRGQRPLSLTRSQRPEPENSLVNSTMLEIELDTFRSESDAPNYCAIAFNEDVITNMIIGI